jgi:metallo-beta-lactamase family protein
MLSGGNSPRYLTEFAARYSAANVILTGYQAVGTTGRTLQNHLKAGDEEATVTTEANPFATDWPASADVEWTTIERDDGAGRRRVTRATIPTDWIHMTEGLSGHASQQGLRRFARDVSAPTVALVHGPDHAQDHLARDFVENLTTVEEVTRARLLTPIAVDQALNIEMASISSEQAESSSQDLRDRVDRLNETVSRLNEELADLRTGSNLSENEVREIIRDEIAEDE